MEGVYQRKLSTCRIPKLRSKIQREVNWQSPDFSLRYRYFDEQLRTF